MFLDTYIPSSSHYSPFFISIPSGPNKNVSITFLICIKNTFNFAFLIYKNNNKAPLTTEVNNS